MKRSYEAFNTKPELIYHQPSQTLRKSSQPEEMYPKRDVIDEKILATLAIKEGLELAEFASLLASL